MGSNSRASPLVCGFTAQLAWQRSNPDLFLQEQEGVQFKCCCLQQKWLMGRSFANHLHLFQSPQMASCPMASKLEHVMRAWVPSSNVLRQTSSPRRCYLHGNPYLGQTGRRLPFLMLHCTADFPVILKCLWNEDKSANVTELCGCQEENSDVASTGEIVKGLGKSLADLPGELGHQ